MLVVGFGVFGMFVWVRLDGILDAEEGGFVRTYVRKGSWYSRNANLHVVSRMV